MVEVIKSSFVLQISNLRGVHCVTQEETRKIGDLNNNSKKQKKGKIMNKNRNIFEMNHK